MQGSTANKWQSRALNPGGLALDLDVVLFFAMQPGKVGGGGTSIVLMGRDLGLNYGQADWRGLRTIHAQTPGGLGSHSVSQLQPQNGRPWFMA